MIKDATKMIPVRKDLILIGQIRSARIHEIDTGQPVFARDLLSPQVFFDCDRIVGPALDRRIVTNNNTVAPGNTTDTGDQASRGRLPLIHAMGRQR